MERNGWKLSHWMYRPLALQPIIMLDVLAFGIADGEGKTIVYNLVLSPTSEVRQTHVNLVAVRLTLTLHFNQQSASSLRKPTFTLFSSTCLLPCPLQPPFLPLTNLNVKFPFLNDHPPSSTHCHTSAHCLPSQLVCCHSNSTLCL